MRAVQLKRFGDPDVLQIVEIPKPAPGLGEVLIRSHAVGVNFFEVLMRADRHAVTPELPIILGVEAAGIVEAVGPQVDASLLGKRVAAPLFMWKRPYGGYADYVTIDSHLVVPLPDELAFDHATALMVQGLTALHLLRQSPPEGKSILLNAAAGGVGTLLIQLAKRAGARQVIAAAGTPGKLDFVSSLGADVGIDYSEPDWPARTRKASGGAGVDIVYDMVGGAMTAAALDALAPGGELVFGAMGRFALDTAQLEAMLAANQSLKGFALLPLLSPERLRSDLGELFQMASTGELKVVLGERYPLDRASEAHRAIEERRSAGKIVLVP